MAKLVLTPITDNDHATTMNANLDLIEAAVENTLSLDGTSPNAMSADFDLNSNFVLNMPAGTADTHPLQKQQIEALIIASDPNALPVGVANELLVADGLSWVSTGSGLTYDPALNELTLLDSNGPYSTTLRMQPWYGFLEIVASTAGLVNGSGLYIKNVGDVGLYDANTATPAASSPPVQADTPIAYYSFWNSLDEFLGHVGYGYWLNDATMFISNEVRGGEFVMSAVDAAGNQEYFLTYVPDGAVQFGHGGTMVARSVAAASGGLEINNTSTGAGWERALTVSDGFSASTAQYAALIGNASGGWEEADTSAVLIYDVVNASANGQIYLDAYNHATAYPAIWVNVTGEACLLKGDDGAGTFNLTMDTTLTAANERVNLTYDPAGVGTYTQLSIRGDGRVILCDSEIALEEGTIKLFERTTALGDDSAYGQWWVRDDAPNTPMFTDDTGSDQNMDPSVSEINTQDGDYTFLITDKGKTIYKAAGGAGETYTIPANASVAYKVGTWIAIDNDGGGDLTIAITTDTLEGTDGATGSRTLGDDQKALIQKVTSTKWRYQASDL